MPLHNPKLTDIQRIRKRSHSFRGKRQQMLTQGDIDIEMIRQNFRVAIIL